MLSREFIDSYREKSVPWSGLSYFTYKRTYARAVDKDTRSLLTQEEIFNRINAGVFSTTTTTEEWYETIGRAINGAQSIGADYSVEEMESLYDHMFNLRAIYSGRMLWRLGTSDKLSKYGDSVNNCWFAPMNSITSFAFLFEELMMGGGVGFSVRRQDINELPRIKRNVAVKHEKTNDADFIVPDSREGWVTLLRQTLNAFFYTGKSFTYSTILVRGKGEPIKGFGGTASGAGILVEGIEKIVNVIQSREGKKLRSTDVLDICNIIGSVVVAGNVRRSAQIALGDSDDILFLRAKRWDLGSIPNWRAYSNNTVYADTYDYALPELWEGYNGNGEPYGLFNLALSQSQGRLGEYVIDPCEGLNPCGEVTLSPYESCNLAELPLNNIRGEEELTQLSILMYKTQKAVAAMPYLYKETEQIVHKNMRLGLSVTGITQSLDKLDWLDKTYVNLRAFDKVWSEKHGWPQSIKLTTLKPSGTVSLLTGSTPGIHPAFAEYYIRRVRVASDSPLIPLVQQFGYDVEPARNYDGSLNRDTSIVSFPIHMPAAVYVKDMSAIRQLELVKKLQTVWADNSISVTVYYRKEELHDIQAWLADNYESSIKAVSFLLHSDHGFDQAPYEEIDENTYNTLVSYTQRITPQAVQAYNDMLEDECATGSCPIR